MNINSVSSQSSSITTVMQNMGLNDQTGLIAASLLVDASGCECENDSSTLMLLGLMMGSSSVTSTVSMSSSQAVSAYSSSLEQPSQLNVEA